MSRLERNIKRDIQKKVKGSKKAAEKWYAEHEAELQRRMEISSEFDDSFGAVKAKRRIPNIAWIACVGIMMLIIAITVAVVLTRNQAESEFAFGEDSVQSFALEEGELAEVLDEIPQLNHLQQVTGTKSVYQQDQSIVMVMLSGEMETINDYYFIEAKIVYNDYFIFLDKWEYDELDEKEAIGGTSISYKSYGTDEVGLYVYLAVTETQSAMVYWKVSCIEGLFDEWLESMFGTR